MSDDRCVYCKQKETLEHLLYECDKSALLWKEVHEWIKIIVFGSYGRDITIIILVQANKKYKLVNISIMATKMVIYSNRNSTLKLQSKQVKFVMKDLFQVEEYWTETNYYLGIHYMVK